MKTKKILPMLMLILISICCNLKSTAAVHNVQLDNTYNPEFYYFCGGVNDTVIVHKPIIAINAITWLMPQGSAIFGQDSVIVTFTQQGNWYFSSNETGKDFYIYFISTPPVQPSCMAHDTSFCTSTINWTLNAGNTTTGCTYLWDNGSTGQFRTLTTIGTRWCRITNDCGQRTDTIHITQSNPNAPHLGADQTFCWGSTTTLNPLSTNVTSYQWSTGETTSTITVDTTSSCWVYLVDNNGCSGRDTVQITALVPTDEPICYVEFDTLTWKNNTNWTTNLPSNADSVHIYKEVSLNVWNKIGSVPKTISHFLDMASAPQAQSYSYKIAVVDTCGNESNLSSYHTTITLLSAYDVNTNTYGFNWSAYHGLTVSDYYLYGINALNQVTQIASVPGNVYMYNYVTPNLSYIKYFVGFQTPSCNAKTNVIVKSNWIQSVITSVHEVVTIPFSVFPNPATNQLTINIGLEDFQVDVFTALGQVILSQHNTKVLDVNNLPQGVYIISISADGIQTNKMFIKN